MKTCFGVIGGDQRQAELVRLLREDGNEVVSCGLGLWLKEEACALEEAVAANVVILPLPLCREAGYLNCRGARIGTKELFELLRPGQLILAGQVKEEQLREAEECGIQLTDYFQREELTVANAAATAEAAVQTALEQLDQTILGMDCLVLGFGRIGKLLTHLLRGMGVRVTATARRPEDLAWIRAYGYPALDTRELNGKLHNYNIIFNTIPAQVLDEKLLAQMKRDCLCIDLASVPGIDQMAADRLGLPYIWARFLPGRMVPRTAARIIRDTVYYIMEERSESA